MDSREETGARVRDLAGRADRNDILTHTEFLSPAEQADAFAALAGVGVPEHMYSAFGGYDDAERRVIFFLPSWLDRETLAAMHEGEDSVIACLGISPLNARFSDHPGHRDYLGALMNLGIERDRIGDILVRGDSAYVFVLRAMAETIAADLTSVRHTTVRCVFADPGKAELAPHFRTVTGSVASERLDALLSMVWHLSRTAAKALVEAEQVYADGRLVTDAGRQVRAGTRVSVRGKGKFIYDGMQARSRKDRLMVTIRIYE